MEGRRLGNYVLERELGSGGMGAVWLATTIRPTAGLAGGGRVAVKIVHPHLLARHGAFKRFLREADVGRRLRHDNLVATYDIEGVEFEGRSVLFLVMEYVEGRTLRELVAELGTVPEALLREIGRQVADGLAAIHAAQCIHRDLKPENVLITDDHQIRIMDFGVARLVDESIALTQPGEFIGSLLYAAPEQLRREEAGHRADLYSLGVMLYELATGFNPFADDSAARVIASHLREVPPRADERQPELSPLLTEVLALLLAKSPDDRLPTAAFVRDLLENGEASAWWTARAPAVHESTVDRLRLPVQRRTDIRGRDAELDVLRKAWSRASEGRGAVLLVEGEAGIGKTRLLDQFVSELPPAQANVLYGSYPPSGGMGALTDAIVGFCGAYRLEEALRERLTETPRLVPALAAFLRHEAAPPGSEALGAQAVHAVLCHLLRSFAAERPTVWIIDDLHFAEPESRQVVLSLARAVEGQPALLVIAARPGLPGDEIAHFSRLRQFRRQELGRLSPREVIQLLRDALRNRNLADRLGADVAYKSDGVPYFVLELVEELKESDVLRELPDGSFETTREIQQLDVPSAVRDLVRGRLAELSDEERAILDAAAAQGFEFDAGIIAEVRAMRRVVVLERLASLERRLNIVKGGGGRCRFDHHQIQEVLYADLLPELREEYHGLIADALDEQERDETGEDPEGEAAYQIAHHHLRGNRPRRCRRVLSAAREHLISLYRHAAALDLTERALAVPKLLRNSEREAVLLHQADVLGFLSNRAARRKALDEALALAEESGDPARQARVQRRLGWHLNDVPDPVAAREALLRALSLAREAGDRLEEAKSIGNLGAVELYLNRLEEARALYLQQLDLGVELGSRELQAIARGNLGLIHKRLGRHQEAREDFELDLELARKTGDRRGEAQTMTNLGALLSDHGRPEEALELYESALVVFREIGDRRGEAAVTANRGNVAKRLGRWAEALESHGNHRRLSREMGSRIGEAIAQINLGSLFRGMGANSQAREALTAAREIAEELSARRLVTHASEGLAMLAEAEALPADAEALHQECLELRRGLPSPHDIAASLVALGRTRVTDGRTADAVEPLTEALELASEHESADSALLATAWLAVAGCATAAELAVAFETWGERVPRSTSIEAHHAAWLATGETSHRDTAREALETLIRGVPARYQASMRQRVALHRAVLADA